MPQTPHIEKHFTSGEVVRDVVIGMSDGLTVPFALAAGLSGAVATTGIIVTAGFAEIVAGSIAMGLGGYLAGKSDVEHFDSEYDREIYEIEHMLEHEKDEVVEILENYGLTKEESVPIVDSLAKRPADFADFMMRFELGLEKPNPKRALQSGAAIGGAYIFGGLIPLSPYIIFDDVQPALLWSVVITVIALFVFGYVKGTFTGTQPLRSAFQTCLIGSVAAATAYYVAHLIGG
ncbi:MAG: VIT1/CCC1 transporter family protein [Acidobacteriota bacterium]|jgi:VIT1/CCC1 family predicted Fe2+/Mn2+ transporter|nr:VIT1/CCC1 transporter family protein [Acidobacteriota bacterium]MDQ3372661.1 VIT1/CCC1 transporter family protein [Acidobacteriota bacterium]